VVNELRGAVLETRVRGFTYIEIGGSIDTPGRVDEAVKETLFVLAIFNVAASAGNLS